MKNTGATKIFADRLSDLIESSGKKMKEIADECDVAIGSLSKYQNDGGEAGINSLLKIANYFDVSTDYLLGRTENQKSENQFIGKELGLSDYAISAIKEIMEYEGYISDTEMLNYFIVSGKLEELLCFAIAYCEAENKVRGLAVTNDTELYFDRVDSCAANVIRTAIDFIEAANEEFNGFKEPSFRLFRKKTAD